MATPNRFKRDFKSGTLGALLAAGGGSTTITFAADPGLPTLGANEHAVLAIDQEIMYLSPYTAAALTGTVARAQEGTAAVLHSNGATWRHVPTRRDFASGRLQEYFRNTADLTPTNATSWADLDTAGDCTIFCQENDLVEVGCSAAAVSGTQDLYLDVVTRPSGSNVNSIGHRTAPPTTTGEGIQAWRMPASVPSAVGGSVLYRMAAADVSGLGTCLFRWRYRYPGAGTRTIKANADAPLQWYVKNHGPKEAVL